MECAGRRHRSLDLVTGASPIGYAYAPPTGYTATALASGPDNHLHVLWNNASGNITLWDVLLGSTPVSNAYGPYAGYTALALSVGSDDHVHVLWNHSPDNQIALWDVNLSGVPTGTPYGPYAGYIAKALSVSADNRTHVVWNSVPGQISLWSVNPSGAYTFVNYPSASGLTLSAASVPGGTPVTGTVTLNARRARWCSRRVVQQQSLGGDCSIQCHGSCGSNQRHLYGQYGLRIGSDQFHDYGHGRRDEQDSDADS